MNNVRAQFLEDVVHPGEGEVGMQGLLALAVRIQPLSQVPDALLQRAFFEGGEMCRRSSSWRKIIPGPDELAPDDQGLHVGGHFFEQFAHLGFCWLTFRCPTPSRMKFIP